MKSSSLRRPTHGCPWARQIALNRKSVNPLHSPHLCCNRRCSNTHDVDWVINDYYVCLFDPEAVTKDLDIFANKARCIYIYIYIYIYISVAYQSGNILCMPISQVFQACFIRETSATCVSLS